MRPMRRMTALAVATVMVMGLAGCGEESAGEPSGLSTPFSIGADGTDEQVAIGHGVSVRVPSDWTPSADEQLDPQGRTYEWAVQAPTDGATAFPAFVSMSMGVPGATSTGYDAAPDALKTVEGVSPEFEVLDEGEVDVEGVDNAYQVRYLHSGSYGGEPVQVQSVQVFLDMPGDVLSAVRFQAPADEFDESGVSAILDSLTVNVED
ncbi:hypothetical protein GCM10009795_028800 [Nocardioides hankookensis]